MSRIGKLPVTVPDNVQVQLKDNRIHVDGVKGKLDFEIPSGIKVRVAEKRILIERTSGSKKERALHGLTRNLIQNMVRGTAEGFQKELEIQGVGFRAQTQGKKLELFLGFSQPVEMVIPDGVTIETPKPTIILVKGADKAKVGECAARIHSYFPPEPYKGKGIRYKDERVRRKAGKSVAKTAA